MLLALATACALLPHEARATGGKKKTTAAAAVALTVQVTVIDEHDKFIPNGTVTITRGGEPKKGEIFKGVASISGNFFMKDDYTITAEAVGYKQREPSFNLPVEVLREAAARADKTAALRPPIVMISQPGVEPPAELSQPQKQFLELLSKHPELIDTAFQQADSQPELQKRVSEQLKGGRYQWVKAAVARPLSLWDFWWIPGLLLALALGVLADRVLRWYGQDEQAYFTGQQFNDTRPAAAPPTSPAANAHAGMKTGAEQAIPATLEFKVTQLIRQQESLTSSVREALERLSSGAGDGAAGQTASGGSHAQRQSGAAHSGGTSTETGRWLGDASDHARSNYRRLVNFGQSSPAPRYLDAEVVNSPKDFVGDRRVYLIEVAHTQGAFVIFAGEDGRGWVFPNPHLNFSPALRPVFPQLTAGDFNNSRESVDPAPAERAGDERWVVERST